MKATHLKSLHSHLATGQVEPRVRPGRLSDSKFIKQGLLSKLRELINDSRTSVGR